MSNYFAWIANKLQMLDSSTKARCEQSIATCCKWRRAWPAYHGARPVLARRHTLELSSCLEEIAAPAEATATVRHRGTRRGFRSRAWQGRQSEVLSVSVNNERLTVVWPTPNEPALAAAAHRSHRSALLTQYLLADRAR